MEFIIRWMETHNPANWGDTKEEGLQKILDTYPCVEHWFIDDGWIECDCEVKFRAKSIKDAMKYVDDNFDCEIYSVIDLNRHLLFTEEGEVPGATSKKITPKKKKPFKGKYVNFWKVKSMGRY